MYYKCVAINDKGEKVSYVVKGKVAYTYRVGVWTRWRRYGAFVFGTLESVSKFLSCNTPVTGIKYEVWECEVRDVRRVHNIIFVDALYSLTRNKIISLMNKANAGFDVWNSYSKSAPIGSYMASQIKLTKLVSPEDYRKIYKY